MIPRWVAEMMKKFGKTEEEIQKEFIVSEKIEAKNDPKYRTL